MSEIEGTDLVTNSKLNISIEPEQKLSKTERIGVKVLGKKTAGLARLGWDTAVSLAGRVKRGLISALKGLARKINALFFRVKMGKKVEYKQQTVDLNEPFDQLMTKSDRILPMPKEDVDVLRNVFGQNPKIGDSGEAFRDVLTRFIDNTDKLFEDTLNSLEATGDIPDNFEAQRISLMEDYAQLGLVADHYQSGETANDGPRGKVFKAWNALGIVMEQVIVTNIQALTDSFPAGGINPEDYRDESLPGTASRLVHQSKDFLAKTFQDRHEAEEVLGKNIMKGFGPKIVSSTTDSDLISWVDWRTPEDERSIKRSCRFGMAKFLKAEGKLDHAREVEIQLDLGDGVDTYEKAEYFFQALKDAVSKNNPEALAAEAAWLVKKLGLADGSGGEYDEAVTEDYRRLLEDGMKKIDNSMFKVMYAVNAPDADIEGVKKIE